MTTDKFAVREAHNTATSVLAVLIGMQPAFRHKVTGESHLAQNEQGLPTHVYSFDGLPEEWVVERDPEGKPMALHPDIVPGYWRDAQFIELELLSQMPLDS